MGMAALEKARERVIVVFGDLMLDVVNNCQWNGKVGGKVEWMSERSRLSSVIVFSS